ncbi:YbhB/YbcL family Raf kinase inhibitor-like protein [Nocardia sp. NPDC056952]|uniref:YbhB/YbcL family Raf kinase inhibitor-like protein n=1 Tax=Nocardia sp. NPDC056952 TaxID=3345979 RepID=UPI003635F7A2
MIGKLLRRVRVGQDKLAWNMPALQSDNDLALRSDDFAHEADLPVGSLSAELGGHDVSPALQWNPPPAGTAQLLLVIQDADVPLPFPLSHVFALIDPSVTTLPSSGLNTGSSPAGVRLLAIGTTSGYGGPEPLKGHGRHRYAVQLFALPTVIPDREPRRLKTALGAIDHVLARGRIDGFAERT